MITLQQLRYFKEVAESEHLTQTAEKLFISQTALSSMIKSLEQQVGIKLFDRSGRRLKLNNAGYIYLQHIRQMFEALENGQIALDDLKEESESKVSFIMSSSNLWAGMIRGFSNAFPSYIIHQENCNVDKFREKLLHMELDYVITAASVLCLDDLEYRIIRNESLYLCVPPNHQFANRKSIYLEEIKNEPFISLPTSAPFRLCCDLLFKQAGFSCNSVLECDYTLRSNLVESGFGLAITTQLAYDTSLFGKKNKYILIADSFAKNPLSIIWNPRRYLSRAAIDFRQYLIEFCESKKRK